MGDGEIFKQNLKNGKKTVVRSEGGLSAKVMRTKKLDMAKK